MRNYFYGNMIGCCLADRHDVRIACRMVAFRLTGVYNRFIGVIGLARF